jgi:hypothetical protein
LSYSRFIEYLDSDKIKTVVISEDGRRAYAEIIVDGYNKLLRTAVELLPDPDLLKKL